MFRSPLLVLVFLEGFLFAWAQRGVSLIPPPISASSSTSASATSSTSSVANSSNSAALSSTSSTTAFPSLSTYSACVSNCLQTGVARVNCSSLTDVNCFCKSPTFPNEVDGCILSDCPSELQSAQSLAQQFCDLASSSPSLSFIPATSTSSSNTASTSSTSSSSAPSTTTSSLGLRNFEAQSWNAVVGLSILLGGSLTGAGIWFR
ncbi:hypothetical protein CPB83DRAFT_548147 [Crepidotus variabilis]|uniref:CFEM domain-containing protein n=1 Tax=Crepidotus variabilis TaxID=179855 RepID=A0A9P6E9T6_9AGAR|nr:hypothetical protein CPB83DRAFT_548147 [Crepidotus variabilis]